MTLVSVLIPCYNAENWVRHAIESALAQDHSEVEVIVVDDGSQDNSLEVIKTFEIQPNSSVAEVVKTFEN